MAAARGLLIGLLLLLASTACSEDLQPSHALADAEQDAEGGESPRSTPRILQETGYPLGSSEAPITVVEFSDFGCRFCAEFSTQTLPTLLTEFVEQNRVRWIFVPVASGAYPNGREAARAAICAGHQQNFWAFHDALFAQQRRWMRERSPEEHFVVFARDAGLDVEEWEICYEDPQVDAIVDRANRAALLMGVRAYPTFLVDGRMVEGAITTELFRDLLNRTR